VRLVEALARVDQGQPIRRWDGARFVGGGEALPNHAFITVDADDQGLCVIVSGKRLLCWRLDDDLRATPAALPDGARGGRRHLFDGDTLWVGTRAGVFEIRGGQATKHNARSGLAGNTVNDLARAADGAVVVGTSGGFSLIRPGQAPETVKTGLGEKSVERVRPALDGALWFSGYRTLTRRDADGRLTKFQSRQGISRPGAVVPLASGDALVSTENGFRWIARGEDRTRPLEVLDALGRYKRGVEDSEGRVWLVNSDADRILLLRDGAPPALFVPSNLPDQHSYPEKLLIHGDTLCLVKRYSAYGYSLSGMLAALERPADDALLYGERALNPVALPRTPAAGAAPAAVDEAAARALFEGKKVAITGAM